MSIYGMITTSASERYTQAALSSFFSSNSLESSDRFYLIDNDGNFDGTEANLPYQLVKNPSPRSFAENVNRVIYEALQSKTSLYFLNNDVIFPRDWKSPLPAAPPGITAPLCNQQLQYDSRAFNVKHTMTIEEFEGHEGDFERIAAAHRARATGVQRVLSLPFFCVYFPYEILEMLGYLDVSFGKGGAEDNDYCLRAALAGIPVQFACASYVLHFSGKSTWAGAEMEDETRARVSQYRKAFEEKWGKALCSLVIDFDNKVLGQNRMLEAAARRGDLKALVNAALELDGRPVPQIKVR